MALGLITGIGRGLRGQQAKIYNGMLSRKSPSPRNLYRGNNTRTAPRPVWLAKDRVIATYKWFFPKRCHVVQIKL